jgi:MULE transposase domain
MPKATIVAIMDPPAEGTFATRSDLVDTAQKYAMTNGYAISTKRSCNRDGVIVLGCDRGGQYRSRHGLTNETRVQDTSTWLQGCPFEIRGKLKDGIWFLIVKEALHNHEPLLVPSAHPIQRRMPESVKSQVKELTEAGIPTQQIATVIRQTSDHPIVAQNIYNTQKKVRLEGLKGKTPMEALVAAVNTELYTFNYKTDIDGRVTHFFFAHPYSISLLNQYPDVLLLDCTYKTNRFKMPLLNIVGSTCMHKTYYVSFCFLHNEIEESYIWALQQLSNLFANKRRPYVMIMDRDLALLNAVLFVFLHCYRQICTWHVEKNMLVFASQFLKEEESHTEFLGDWTQLVTSTTVEIYNTRWQSLQTKYSLYPALVKYLSDTWLTPWKESIIHAWTDQYYHFGHYATSRVEGSHKTIKSYLQVSTSDLKKVFDKIATMLTGQHAEYKVGLEINKSRTPHVNKDPFYEQLLGRVSHYVLGKLWDQRYHLQHLDQLPKCTRLFMSSMGLPCAHIMQQRIQDGGQLLLEDIHSHWHLFEQTALAIQPLVLEPAMVIAKGRPGSQPKIPAHRQN